MADLGTVISRITKVTTAWIQDLNNLFYRILPRQYINVLNYSATGDGTADDTSYVQAARTAAVGKTLRFPSGTYRMTATTVFNCDVSFDPGAVLHVESGSMTFVKPVHAPIRSKILPSLSPSTLFTPP